MAIGGFHAPQPLGYNYIFNVKPCCLLHKAANEIGMWYFFYLAMGEIAGLFMEIL